MSSPLPKINHKIPEGFSTELVNNIYSGLLGSKADQKTLESWELRLKSGEDLGQLVREIIESEEFFNKFIQTKREEFVARFYQGLLGREPDDEGLRYYTSRLCQSEDFAKIIAAIGASEEHWFRLLANRSEEFVRGIYKALLEGNPETTTLEKYSPIIGEKNGISRLIQIIVGSEEFKARQRQQQNNSGFDLGDLEERKIVFLHLPKTGGTTLHHLLIQQVNPTLVCPERLNCLHTHPAGELARYRLFSGHFDLASTQLIPGRKAIITMFRDPVRRLVSLYYFQRAHGSKRIETNDLELARLANKYSLAEFFGAAEVRAHPSINNAMTRALTQRLYAWRWQYRADIGSEEQSLDVDQAIEALQSLDAFGITEMYDESVRFIFSRLGLPRPEQIEPKMVLDTIVREDPGLQAIVKEPVTEKVLGLMEDLVVADRKLYRKALEFLREKSEP